MISTAYPPCSKYRNDINSEKPNDLDSKEVQREQNHSMAPHRGPRASSAQLPSHSITTNCWVPLQISLDFYYAPKFISAKLWGQAQTTEKTDNSFTRIHHRHHPSIELKVWVAQSATFYRVSIQNMLQDTDQVEKVLQHAMRDFIYRWLWKALSNTGLIVPFVDPKAKTYTVFLTKEKTWGQTVLHFFF